MSALPIKEKEVAKTILRDTHGAGLSSTMPSVLGEISPAPAAIRDQVGTWVVSVVCPYCRSRHQHSAPKGPGIDPGFKIAHCRLDRQGYKVIAGGLK